MSPVNQSADFFLNAKPYMLARTEPFKGRAWQRTGQPDTPSRRSEIDAKYGVVEDTLDHPEVWDDWSGGFGQAYRRAGENTYHWAENFDARWSRQLVHCQTLQTFNAEFNFGGPNVLLDNVTHFHDVGLPSVALPEAGM